MKKNLLYVFIPGFFVLNGCRPRPIDIDVKPADPKLVVASQIIPRQIMIVALTKSFSALEGEANRDSVPEDFLDRITAKDAFVTVSYLDKVDTLAMIAPGIYIGTKLLQVDYGTYTLYARDPKTGEEITATSTLLPAVSFDSIQPRLVKTFDDTTIYIDYSFTDIPGGTNYYVINFYSKASGDGTGIDINSYFTRGSNQLQEFELVSDQTFDGNRYHGSKNLTGKLTPSDSVAVTISNISEGYFKFLSAYKKSGSLFNQISGEPINYPTNVLNGYGYFNTHYPSVEFFDLKNY